MNKLIPIILTVVFLLALLSFTVTYTVRFTEAAVVTTFGKASEEPVTEPGLRFKWPYPIQTVTTYDTRLRLLQTRAEAQQTADDRQIIIEGFLTWRVSDPEVFFERFSNAGSRADDHFEAAERTLRSLLAGAMAETGRYTLNELFRPGTAEGGSKLAELEGRILGVLGQGDAQTRSIAEYGIEATAVGIHRVRLAEETTGAVNDRIAANRDRLAREIEAAGDAEAAAIRAAAESDRQRILAFAKRRADAIRAEGVHASAAYLARMNERPDLAVFLKNLDFLGEAFNHRTTVILSSDFPGLRLLDPKTMSETPAAELPDSGLPRSWGNRSPAGGVAAPSAEGDR